jgi:hypothetical protein
MESITNWILSAISKPIPELNLSWFPDKLQGKLRTSPEQLLEIIHARQLAEWALHAARGCQRPRLKAGAGGRPTDYQDNSIMLMAVVQTVWRKSYDQIVDYVATHEPLAIALGFTQRRSDGKVQTISKGQYWERRAALGVLPFWFFFLALVAQLFRLGAITGKELLVDATLLRAWYHADPGATWQKYARKGSLFGYKVHTLLCRHASLPVFVLVTPAHVHESLLGWLMVLTSVIIFGFQVVVVYADAAYFDRRFFRVVHDILGAHPAVNYNVRRAGKRKLATLFFLEQWQRLVIAPRTAIERHFAWAKRYFGLKYFQCFTLMRVTQFVLLTYVAMLAVALVAYRCQRPELVRSRAIVLASI